MTEEDTKRLYITPAIERKWHRNFIRMEEYFTDGRVIVHGKQAKREKGKKADYILYYKNQAISDCRSEKYRKESLRRFATSN